jgi:tRNA pseudouridine38-40 synthase
VRNLKLTIEFDGAGFFGWQFQPDRKTVQAAVQDAVAEIFGERLTVYGCGRTDAGVSARNYVANFHTGSGMKPERMRQALNFHLPSEVHVKAVEDVGPEFHARFSARSKVYEYRMVRGYSPLRHARAWELRRPVDAARMRKALALFEGYRDFRPFCATTDSSGRCTVMKAELAETADELVLTIQGDRFLYKMVRRIAGAVASYGSGRITLSDLRAALAGRKHRPYRTAPAAGLVLDSVQY